LSQAAQDHHLFRNEEPAEGPISGRPPAADEP
jgi:hypothetical protein